MREGWRFRLAGPLEVRHDGVRVPLGAAKQRILLSALALAAGEPVTTDRLIACLWGDQPPASARNTLQNYVLRLRRTLRDSDAEAAGLLVGSAAGYRLEVDPDTVDVNRFRSLLRAARSDLTADARESAAARLDEALALWRGDPLADVPSEVLHREVVPGLAEQWLDALELRIGLDLGFGRHAERITDLVALTNEHPLRERMWAHLMLALYRSGRSAEALDAYRQAGKALAEDLGIDPGPELRKLHRAILAEDPGLTITGRTIVGGTITGQPRESSPEQAGAAAGAQPRRPHQPRLPCIVPRQLPPPNVHFVGRAAEVEHLGARAQDAGGSPVMVISAIGGTAGIGKTALALQWGHAHADRFPDGQLYVNLRGFDPAGDPVSSMAAMRGFLAALGVAERELPAGRDEQVALYRSLLAGRRMLLVLDNARDSEQVRPLLPGAPGCLVLVTSRDQLAGLVALDGAVPLPLGLLGHDEARDLLVRRLGRERVAREQAEVDELIERCARLPLALNIAAAHAALHPSRPLAGFLARLRDTRRTLDALTTDEAAADIRAVFACSYRTLTPATARVFRLLGECPGQDVGLLAAASLAGHDLDTTRRALHELTRAHLLIEQGADRYGMHDLLRLYAAEQAAIHDGDAGRRDALRRVVDFYTRTAYDAELVLTPTRVAIPLDPPAPVPHAQPMEDAADALAWFDAEHANLLAVQQAAVAHGRHPVVWQLAWSAGAVHERRGYRRDRLRVWQAALESAAHLPDPAARRVAHRRLAVALADLGRRQEAVTHAQRALELAEEHGDLAEQAAVHHMLAWIWEGQGDRRALERAVDHATRTLQARRALGIASREAEALNLLGWCLARIGDFEAARARCEEALAILQSDRDPEHEAATLDSLGFIADRSSRHRQAVGYYRRALPLLTELGDLLRTADTLEKLGIPHAALGEHEQARTAWRRALELYRQQGRDEAADRVRHRLEDLLRAEGSRFPI